VATQLSIVNNALNELGEVAVSNINDSEHAKILDQKIDLNYRVALSITNWVFAQKFESISLTTEPGIPEFPFAYQLPFDFEKLVDVNKINDYRLLGDKLYVATNQGVDLFYISNQIVFSLFPSTFEQYLVYKIAAQSCLVLTNSVPVTEYLVQQETRTREWAVFVNANLEGYREHVVNKYDRGNQVL